MKFCKGCLVVLATGAVSPITDRVNEIVGTVGLAAAAIDRLGKLSRGWIGFSIRCER